MIYDTESSSKPVGTIDIKNTCHDVHVGLRSGRFPSWVPFPCTFVISLRNKKLYLYASSVSDALQWVKALRRTSDSFKTGQKEMRDIDHRLAILRESGAEGTQTSWSSCTHDDNIPPPPPVPAVLPVMPAMTDNLATENDPTTSTGCATSTGQEACRTASFTLPKSFSRDRDSSNRRRKEALWHILKKKEVESQLTVKGVHEAPLRGEDERPVSAVQLHQVRAFGSHENDRQTPVMESCDTVPAPDEPFDCHPECEPTPASFPGIKTSQNHKPKTNKCDKSTCIEGCHGNTKHEKEEDATRRRAIKVKRSVSAQPLLESLPERESPIGASKTSLDEESDGQLRVSSRMHSMESFTYLNFSDDHDPPPFRSQSCAESIHRSRDISIPELSTPSPCVPAQFTPPPNAITRSHRGRVARKNPAKPPNSRNVTFSEFATTYSPIEVPEDASPVVSNAEGTKWSLESSCVPLEYAPTRQGAVMRRDGTTPSRYRRHPTMDSETAEVSIRKHLLLIEVPSSKHPKLYITSEFYMQFCILKGQ